MWYTQTRTELVRAELATIDKGSGRRELTRVGAVLLRSLALFESMSDPQNRCVFPVATQSIMPTGRPSESPAGTPLPRGPGASNGSPQVLTIVYPGARSAPSPF